MKRLILLFPLLACALLAIWITSGAPPAARAEWELNLDEKTYSIASDGERLYAATEGGIYYSRDDGDTWRWSNFKHPAKLLTGSPDAVYGYSREHGIVRSVSKGNTWYPKNSGLKVRQWENGRWVVRIPYIQQIFVTSSGMVIAVGYHQGTWISRDRGDNWHAVLHEWKINDRGHTSTLGDGIYSMGEFDGYLWLLYSRSVAARSPDEGAAWESIPEWVHGRTIYQFDRVNVWVEFRGNLYVAGDSSFGRWREEGLEWDDLSRGLPHNPSLYSCVVHRDRIFVASWSHGVFIFDHHAEVWHPAGLSLKIPANSLVSHRGNLYAASTTRGHHGVYRAKRPFVSPEGKAAVTWGAIKQK